MRSVARIITVLSVLTALACSGVSGLELAVVGKPPSDIDATISRAAADAGFETTDLRHPIELNDAGSHFFELPRADGAETVNVQTIPSPAGLRIRIGRSIYAAYTVAETAAVSKFVLKLRESGSVLRKTWSSKLVLENDLELWLKGNRKDEA